MSISGQIVSAIVAQLYSEHSIQTLLIFFWGGSTRRRFWVARGGSPIHMTFANRSHHFHDLSCRHVTVECSLKVPQQLYLPNFNPQYVKATKSIPSYIICQGQILHDPYFSLNWTYEY